jgi:hypothetical protein
MYSSTFSRPRYWLEASGQRRASAALLPGKEPQYPFDRRFDGPRSRYGPRGGETIFYPTGTRTATLRSSIPYPVAISIALSRLLPIKKHGKNIVLYILIFTL